MTYYNCVCVSVQYPATTPGLSNMTSTKYLYFIITRKLEAPRHINAGCICYISESNHRSELSKNQSLKKLRVFTMSRYTTLDYAIEVSSMEELSPEEAELLQALPDDAERLKWFKEREALKTALGLKVGSAVTVEEGGEKLRGIVRYVGRITDPSYPCPLSGTYFGIELQVGL